MTHLSYHEPVDRLFGVGDPRNQEEWPNYLSEYGLTVDDIPELVRMAVDEEFINSESDSDEVWGPIHAWHALGQLRAGMAIGPLIGLLHRVDVGHDEWVSEKIPEVLGQIGSEAIPALAEYVADAQHGLWARTAAIEALTEVVKQSPDQVAVCTEVIYHILEGYEQHDPTLNAELIYALAQLKQPETYALVEQAFLAKKVDLITMGDWEDFQVYVGLLTERITEAPMIDWGFNHRHSGKPAKSTQCVHGKTDKKAKDKRKQEKLSRKKNRKKK